MERRQYLLACGAAVGTVTGGCLTETRQRDGLSLEGTAPTLTPGTDVVISATAYNADYFRFWPPDFVPTTEIEVDVSPSPDEQLDSWPPVWIWDTPQPTVDGKLTLPVPSDQALGDYEYGVSAFNGQKRLRADFTIKVER